MIKHLAVKNYALIDDISVSFNSGLTTITGETGSGKSIIIGALKLILGERADVKTLKDVNAKCIVEGIFHIETYNVEDFFSKYDLDYEAETTIRREINPAGKSRAFINDTPVNLAQLSELAERLVDIHSQHETLLLNTTEFQIRLLDSYAGNNSRICEYKLAYNQWKKAGNELQSLIEQDQQAKLDIDYFKFQLEELMAVNLNVNQMEEAELNLKELEHAEDIKLAISNTIQALESDHGGVISNLSNAAAGFSKIKSISAQYEEIYKRLNSTLIELQDIFRELERMDETVDLNPEKAEQLKEQLSTVYTLQQKHRVNSIKELLELKEVIAHKVESAANLDDRITELERQVDHFEAQVRSLGSKLSAGRSKVIGQLCNEVKGILASLNMADAELNVELEPGCSPLVHGTDSVRFVFKANKGGEFKPLKSVASGGELSRLMMTLKAIMARSTNLPTIIFDEIDTGVSGDVAAKMAGIMKEMGDNMQVVAITHLPQIACRGAHHLKVVKDNAGEVSATNIDELNEEQRIIEIAQMLSGAEVTEAAVQNARNLLQA